MSRVLLVSNRLPVTARVQEGTLALEQSVGGLATALSGAKRSRSTRWIGWPGPVSDSSPAEHARLLRRLRELRCVPVPLSAREVHEYYEEIANGVLWPVFHYQPSRVPLAPAHWDTYVAVNERFADVAAREWRPGDDIWVHDYQLMLVPALLRRRLPAARIGFFLHIPFPVPEIFRILPWRSELLDGMLGADLIGFHTRSYADSFRDSALALGRARPGRVPRDLVVSSRTVRIGAYPIGIDARDFERGAARTPVRRAVRALRPPPPGRLMAGVDRLDYTKGLLQRLLAFRRLLESDPALHGQVRLIQVVVPSRTGVRSYREFRRELDAMIGHINGTFGTPAWTPVSYQYRAIAPAELLALYSAADVMLVTPVRDGMNLVAKEYVAVRSREDGVLVLSEFAGAAEELKEALHVNPFDIERTAITMRRALVMPLAQQRRRMAALRRRVFRNTAARWADRFLRHLHASHSDRHPDAMPLPYTSPDEQAQLTARLRRAPFRALLLDYDGTLVRFSDSPGDARPDARLRALLSGLAALPATVVHIVSGRTRETLEAWLGDLPIGLHAEHGLWSRKSGSAQWRRRRAPTAVARGALARALGRVAARVPGSLVESKSAGLAWHFRKADPVRAEREARRVMRTLAPAARRRGLEILRGDKVLEFRPRDVHKGLVTAAIAAEVPAGGRLLALGDDRTDEDLFASLPPSGIAVHVGPGPSRATWRLRDVRAARAFLERLLEG